MKIKKFYINTIGCQMNVYDSQQISERLHLLGYVSEVQVEEADLIILNTCSIREKAEQKAFSFLGRLAKMKREKPRLMVGVCGCVAQQEGQKIIERMPHIDFVLGTQAIDRLPDAIERIEKHRCRIVDVDMSQEIRETADISAPTKPHEVSRFVTIMRGCDNYCTYCVVPYVRGRETSREPENIINEIKSLVANGIREITLLGQNVNSYGHKQDLCDFPTLLKQINDIDGLLRLRFTTSHPKDLSEDLIDAFQSVGKLCHHIHLPVQSGSNDVLARMNRRYTREKYLEMVIKLREICPEIAITSDIIVGFPGETRTDFEQTKALIKQVEFDSLFAFIYSDRPSAPSGRFKGKVTEKEKKQRLQQVFDLQARITQKIHARMKGTVQEVLVEGYSKKQANENQGRVPEAVQWTGRTSGNKIVNFAQNSVSPIDTGIEVGEMVCVRIEKTFPHSLWGSMVTCDSGCSLAKGESYAA
ncbi:tRNA (N6-isopentenyl adenosine(37)-C2)-methylthiotransferase MiaB [Thermodesulfobacteriota bacterium]